MLDLRLQQSSGRHHNGESLLVTTRSIPFTTITARSAFAATDHSRSLRVRAFSIHVGLMIVATVLVTMLWGRRILAAV